MVVIFVNKQNNLIPQKLPEEAIWLFLYRPPSSYGTALYWAFIR
jgi:hypothetical protein